MNSYNNCKPITNCHRWTTPSTSGMLHTWFICSILVYFLGNYVYIDIKVQSTFVKSLSGVYISITPLNGHYRFQKVEDTTKCLYHTGHEWWFGYCQSSESGRITSHYIPSSSTTPYTVFDDPTNRHIKSKICNVELKKRKVRRMD